MSLPHVDGREGGRVSNDCRFPLSPTTPSQPTHSPPPLTHTSSQPPLPPMLHHHPGAKAAGSVVTNAFSDSVHSLVVYGGLVSVGISAFLVYVAAWMGDAFDEHTRNGACRGVRGRLCL